MEGLAELVPKMMNTVLNSFIDSFCYVYVDDIIVYSKSELLHQQNLAHMLSTLSKANLKVNCKKSQFFKRIKATFLGRVLDGSTKNTKEESVDRIAKLAKPFDAHSLRVFLGMACHFRAFIQDCALKTRCLTRLTQEHVCFCWTDECEAAYKDLVRVISPDPVLRLPDFALPFELPTHHTTEQERYFTSEMKASHIIANSV